MMSLLSNESRAIYFYIHVYQHNLLWHWCWIRVGDWKEKSYRHAGRQTKCCFGGADSSAIALITVCSQSCCCCLLAAVHLDCNLVHMVYILSGLMVCGRGEQMEGGGGITTAVTKICHFIPCYWMLHYVRQSQVFVCRTHYSGLRRISLTSKAFIVYCSLYWVLYM